jgi:hypothetical protein
MRLPDSLSTITPEGAVEPINIPTFLLSLEEAVVLRDYVIWMEYRQVRGQLFCKACYEESAEPTAIDINAVAIGVICEHQLLIRFGELPKITRQYENADLLWTPPDGGILLANQVPTIRMSDDESKVLHDYQRVMKTYNLLEAMRCNECWESGHHDGCRATVSSFGIDIICRHRHLQHRGSLATH